MSKRQTDNSFIQNKINLRLNHLPSKDNITVLDVFSGDGYIWDAVKSRHKGAIEVLRIDKLKDKKGLYLKGDNVKYLKIIDLSLFDVIDMDAYGVPYKCLEIVLDRHIGNPFNCILFVTFIQTMYGGLPKSLLLKLGYSAEMFSKIPTLFYMNGLEKLKNWLSLYGVKEIVHRSKHNKHYIYFELKK